MISTVIRSIFILILALTLVETWSVLDPPPNGCVQKTMTGVNCSFPFTFNGYQFSGCTDYVFSKFWCSVDSEFQGKWAFCIDEMECTTTEASSTQPPTVSQYAKQNAFTFCKSRTTDGTGKGAPCAPWFVYKGVNYTDCTFADNPRPWCSMTSSFNDLWGVCSVPEAECQPFCKTFTEGGTAGGAPCKFPFTYQEKMYYECTTIDYKSHWCSTTSYYSRNSWGVCTYKSSCAPTTTTITTFTSTTTTMTSVASRRPNSLFCRTRTILGNAEGAPCATSFSYNGVTYTDCIYSDNARPWCSTTPVYNGAWGVCLAIEECHPFCADRTWRGTAAGAPCVFPFYYKDQEYQWCTTRDHSRHWCGTTSDSRSWGNCVYEPGCGSIEATSSITPIAIATTQIAIATTPIVVASTGLLATSTGSETSTPSPSIAQQTTQYCLTRTILGKGANGAACSPTFSYEGVTYNDCTTVDNPRPWCSITPYYADIWGVCLTIQECAPFCSSRTELGSANEAPCVLPFSYKGVEYSACTTIDHNRHWCATTFLYNKNAWGNCVYAEVGTPNCPVPMPTTPTTTILVTPTTVANGAYGLYCLSKTYGGNSDGAPCASPFQYNGATYRGCIPNERGAWCSTTPVYSGKSGQCYRNNECAPFCTGSTFGGNANGLPCEFPFVYRGVTYNYCITRDHPHTQQWCSVTPNYMGLWGNCIYASPCPVITSQTTSPSGFCTASTIDGNAFGAPCAPVYIYKGRTYYDCTYDDNPRPWCATTANYDSDEKWGVCRVGDCPNVCPGSTERGTADGAKCVFPFRYNGMNFTTCTTIGNRGVLWCSTTAEFSDSWGKCIYEPCPYCPDRTAGGTDYGAPCASSWSYKDKIYSGCIKTDRDRFWCSTTQIYDGRWGECLEPRCKRLCRDRTEGGTAGGDRCVFPFIFKNVVYTSCTTKGHTKLWCATDGNFNNNWGNCVYEC